MVSVSGWSLLVERAAETESLSRRLNLWLEAIDEVAVGSRESPLTVFSPPEATGVVHSGSGAAAQVYALGVLGHALLTGSLPWNGAAGAALRHKILTGHLPAISDPQLPAVFRGRVNRIIARATEKDPAARFSSTERLKAEIISTAKILKEASAGGQPGPRIHQDAYRRIDRWLDRVRGGTASVLTVVGASGIGKTYLWETVQDAHAGIDERWLYVKAGQGSQRPYETVAMLLESSRDEIEVLLTDRMISPPVRALVQAIAPQLGSPDITADASAVRNPARELASVIGGMGVSSTLRVICFDDFQWIDNYSRKVFEELAHGPEAVALATLSREEVNLDQPQETVYLKPLNRDQAEEFTQSLDPQMFAEAFAISGGNPMALQFILQDGTGLRSTGAQDVLSSVAAQRLAKLSAGCRSLLLLMALIGTPASVSSILQTEEYWQEELEKLLIEGEAALLLRRSRLHDSVRFVHDSIETAARIEAERDPRSRQRAMRVLMTDARHGNDRAAYRAIGMVAAMARDEVPEKDVNWVATAAARRAVLSLAPEEALQIVAEWQDWVSGPTRTQLFLIAHEAAYLRGDRREMSRYYRAIVTTGDAEAALEARYMWIRRCYADARFRGALAVGVRILTEFPVIDEPLQWSSDGSEALRFLTRHPPRRVLDSILRRGYTADRAVRRATDTLGRMLLPTLTTDRTHLVHVAYYALRIGMERGATPLTAMGFIAWALFLGTRRDPGRWVAEYMDCAEHLSVRSGDLRAHHSIRMLIAGFGGPWTGSYREYSNRLELLQHEGRELGNSEFVAHALHLQRQALLYRGEPLARVRALLDESRREIRSYGQVRADSALAKHHAVTGVLLGHTDDATRIDDTIVNERDYLTRILSNDDQMSLVGFRTMKAFLALYGDDPARVFEELTKIENVMPAISLFHENLLIRFYLGIAAYRLGRPAVGARMLRLVRRWARENPTTNRHRLMGIRAERAASRGYRNAARRLLARAIPLAVEAGCMNEAALLCERAGDISGDPQYWMMAESGYRHWGAVHAVSRVNRKLGRRNAAPFGTSPGSLYEGIHNDLTSAVSLDEVMQPVARHLFETTYALEVVVSVVSDSGSAVSGYRWDGSAPVGVGPPSADLSLALTETPIGECRLLRSDDHLPGRASGVAGRSHRIDNTELAALAVGAPHGAAYNDSVIPVVTGILAAGALHAARVSVGARVHQTEHELEEVQQQLSATERYRRQLFSTVTDAFLLLDRSGEVRFSNPAAEPFLDRTRSSPVLRDDLHHAVSELIDSPDLVPPLRVRREIGDDRHVQIQAAPVGPDAEDLVAVSISDITDAVDRETQLAQQERQLVVADRLASIGMFSASIVHEISNPNHILQLNTQSLLVVLSWLEDQIDDEHAAATVAQAGSLVEQIEDAARRVESVLQMVKSYSREGRRDRWEVLSPREVCSRAFRFSKIMASQFTDRFLLVIADDELPVWGEAALLEQAVINLIKNACEALPGREGRVELQAYVNTDRTETVLSVCDTGPGFPAGLTDHLGTPFLSGRQDSGGTGLGLSIVSGIVDKHGGYLRVAADEHFTTRVEVHLPAYTEQPD